MMVAENYPSVSGEGMLPPVSLLIDHLDYIVKLVGVDYVGIGSDFDGIEAPPKGTPRGAGFPVNHESFDGKGAIQKKTSKKYWAETLYGF